jgi:hypothetical protein
MEASGMEAKQRTLFPVAYELHPCDRHVAPADKPRLSGQNAAILDRLKRGPATAYQLSAYSLKYTSRISDLRSHGYVIHCVRTTDGGGTVYTLEQ